VLDLVETRAHDVQTAVMREVYARPTRADLDQKAGLADVQAWLATKADKMDTMEAIHTTVRRPHPGEVLVCFSQQQQGARLDSDLRARCAELHAAVTQKAERSELADAAAAATARAARLETELRAATAELRHVLVEKTDRADFEQAMSAAGSRSGKAAADTRAGLAELAAQCTEQQRAFEDFADASRRMQQELASDVALKADRAAVEAALSTKADRGEVGAALERKASPEDVRATLETALAVKANIADVNHVRAACVPPGDVHH
jgi:hypothetical protein